MADNKASLRLDMRITAEQNARIEFLREKKGISRTAAVSWAIKEVSDHEGYNESTTRKKK